METSGKQLCLGEAHMGPLRGVRLTERRHGAEDMDSGRPARIPDYVTLPLLPLGAEAAHPLPVQEGSLLRQRPHHTVSGSDLGQRERTVHLHRSGAGAIHAETCRGGWKAPRDTPSGFHPILILLLAYFSFLVLLYPFLL